MRWRPLGRASNPEQLVRGPAVQLGNAESLFPHILANAWRARNLPSIIVSATSPRRLPPEADPRTRIVDVALERTRVGAWAKRVARDVIVPLAWLRSRRRRPQFLEQTGLAAPQPWETVLAQHRLNAWRVARAARRLSPAFVFAHEVVAYGHAAAHCQGIPRILFPWGADVMTTAEVSPRHFDFVRHALRAADLIVPSSIMAARHICTRFGIDPARVQAISWGADLRSFAPATPGQRQEICARWQIDPAHAVVMNVRRFLPLYNCDTAVSAFLDVARASASTHFVLLGGLDTEPFVTRAMQEVSRAGGPVARRFTFLRSNVSLEICRDLMSIADVAVSLCGRGDMRSRSVLEAAAAGGALVVSDSDEYRAMMADGFGARLVDGGRTDAVARAVLDLLANATERERLRDLNARYLPAHEDAERQMDRLLEAVLAIAAGAAGRTRQ